MTNVLLTILVILQLLNLLFTMAQYGLFARIDRKANGHGVR